MVVALFEKYGVVPKSVYPESVSSSSSRELNAILINCFAKMLKSCVTCLLLVQTKRLFKLRKKTSCKKSLTSLLCHWGFHHVSLTLLIVIRMITTKVKRASHHRSFTRICQSSSRRLCFGYQCPTADKALRQILYS